MIQKNVPLKNYSNYKIGGPAKELLEIKSPQDLENINFSNIFILGGGTNVLLSDEGFEGLVLLNRIPGADVRSPLASDSEDKGGNLMNRSEARTTDVLVEFGSGMMMDDILKFCIDNSFSGLEWAGGLPGTIGGAVRGNAGAFKGEIKDNVYEVESINLKSKERIKRKNQECNFGYRWSIYKENPHEFITTVVLKLTKGDSSEIQKTINEKIEYRNLKHPMDYPNIGSTFKNLPVERISEKQKEEFKDFIKNDPFPVVLTTKLLALADLKGKRIGDAQISEKHPNFIVNFGNAKASDVLSLINFAKKTVREKFNLELEEEITCV